ncbi:hypothetical protein BN946_scf185007.g99 [Trametes cinnabarina]|uniref:Magnesium transporter n=1 Tax=Pycnoporus cinnabarinus TaxID=5643 RepID=A0A060SF85_PYCCI|nr:hypothetical protein BN946_scf185007.g99 [Trametes cinnabarina]
MLEDKYIGLALAISGSVGIGSSFILTKKGLIQASNASAYAAASDSHSYFKSPLWWAGMCLMVAGEIANFAAYAFAPPILVTPLGALSVIIGLCMIYFVVPRYGRSNPLVYISICSLVGSVSVMAIKGLGIAVKLTFAGNNQFGRPATYVFGFLVAGCIVVQMNYFNKALDTFSTNVVNPMYYVGFSTATIVASIILFQGINTDDPANTLSLLAGFITTFLGVHLLELSRSPDSGRSPVGDGYVRTNGDVVGLETLYEPEPEDEDGEDERTHLHSRQRASRDLSTDRVNGDVPV